MMAIREVSPSSIMRATTAATMKSCSGSQTDERASPVPMQQRCHSSKIAETPNRVMFASYTSFAVAGWYTPLTRSLIGLQ